MLSIEDNVAGSNAAKNEDPGARYSAYKTTHVGEINSSEVKDWTNNSGSASDANLAKRLVEGIVGKGFKKDANGSYTLVNNEVELKVSKVTDTAKTATENKKELAWIVKQVVGQDAQRLMDEDNSERTKNIHRLLRFYPGDIIYLNIKLNTPSISVSTGQKVTEGTLENKYNTSQQSYALKITLGPHEEL
jgi:hypothetical protein